MQTAARLLAILLLASAPTLSAARAATLTWSSSADIETLDRVTSLPIRTASTQAVIWGSARH